MAIGRRFAGAQLSVATGRNTGNWIGETTDSARGEADTSYTAFSAVVPGTLDPATGLSSGDGIPMWSRTGTWDSANQRWTGTMSDNLMGNWYSGAGVASGETLATLYVTTGGGISYSGELGVASVTFTTVGVPALLPGDANLDGSVDDADLQIVLSILTRPA